MLLLSRLGDIGSTWFVTPNLSLEANPVVRWLGWRFGLLTLLACLIPYFSIEAAMAMLPTFFLVSASNTGKIWIVRTMGEREYQAMILRLAMKSRIWKMLACVWAASLFTALAGLSLLLVYPDPAADRAFWFGAGIILYAAIVAGYGTLSTLSLFSAARRLAR